MKPGKLFLLPLTLSALGVPGMVFAQNSSELDVTISVIQEGETPAGFINRLELPAVELIEPQPQPALTEQNISETVESISEQAEEATETVTNSIREVLSIDGNGNPEPTDPDSGPVTEIVENLPGQVVDILNPALPLGDTLEEVSDQLGDVVDDIDTPVDGVIDTVTDPVDGIVDTLDDTTTDVLNTTDDLVQDSTENIDDAVTETVETVDESVLEPLDEAVTEALNEAVPEDAGLDDAGLLDNATEQMSIDEITDELRGL